MKLLLLLSLYGLFLNFSALAGRPLLSGGADLRYQNQNGDKNSLRAEGIFLNFRKVFSDQKGDRVIAVGQLDWDDNFDKFRPYQTYIQYKGPLGKWNFLGGHFILPFGLLSDYDSERLLLQSQELKTLGIKLDTGLKLFGHLKAFDYGFTLTQGVGRNRLEDVDNNKLITGRIGWEKDDLRMGLSLLNGKVLTEEENGISSYKKRLAFDLTKYLGPTIFRSELIGGETESQTVYGSYLGIDHSLSTKVEANFKYAYWQEGLTEHFLGIGFSYNVWQRLFLRVANEYHWSQKDQNQFSIQIYYDFIKTL